MDGNLIKNVLCETFGKLYQAGFNTSKSGNISARLGKTMIISPSGVAASDITPETFVGVKTIFGRRYIFERQVKIQSSSQRATEHRSKLGNQKAEW